ncbi:MAG: hypothetical protein DPW16_17615 [Chloroflexi bacterium]|nr:hypothetical protein [Chloroflexota bacterium]
MINLIFYSGVVLLGIAMVASGAKAIIAKRFMFISNNFPFRETRREQLGVPAVIFGIFQCFCGMLVAIRGLFGIIGIEIGTIFWNGICFLFLIFVIQFVGVIASDILAWRIKSKNEK